MGGISNVVPTGDLQVERMLRERSFSNTLGAFHTGASLAKATLSKSGVSADALSKRRRVDFFLDVTKKMFASSMAEIDGLRKLSTGMYDPDAFMLTLANADSLNGEGTPGKDVSDLIENIKSKIIEYRHDFGFLHGFVVFKNPTDVDTFTSPSAHCPDTIRVAVADIERELDSAGKTYVVVTLAMFARIAYRPDAAEFASMLAADALVVKEYVPFNIEIIGDNAVLPPTPFELITHVNIEDPTAAYTHDPYPYKITGLKFFHRRKGYQKARNFEIFSQRMAYGSNRVVPLEDPTRSFDPSAYIKGYTFQAWLKQAYVTELSQMVVKEPSVGLLSAVTVV